jgi:hypothetical protein
MKKIFSGVALCGAMAVFGGLSTSGANAAMLSSGVHALKAEQSGIAEKAYYRCWWHNGHRHCRHGRGHRHCWWRNGYRHCRW